MIGNIIFFLVVVCLQGVTPSQLEQLTPGFIGAVGNDVTCTWEVSASPAVVGQKSRVTLRIRGAINPEQITMQDGMIAHPPGVYQVVSTERVVTEIDVAYQFEIIPNAAGMLTLPGFAYLVFRPGFPEGRRFSTRYLDAVEIVVQPASTNRSQQKRSIPSELLIANDINSSSWPIEVVLLPILCVPWLLFVLRIWSGEHSHGQQRNRLWLRNIRRATTAAELQQHMVMWWQVQANASSHINESNSMHVALMELFSHLERHQYDVGTQTNLSELKSECAMIVEGRVLS